MNMISGRSELQRNQRGLCCTARCMFDRAEKCHLLNIQHVAQNQKVPLKRHPSLVFMLILTQSFLFRCRLQQMMHSTFSLHFSELKKEKKRSIPFGILCKRRRKENVCCTQQELPVYEHEQWDY